MKLTRLTYVTYLTIFFTTLSYGQISSTTTGLDYGKIEKVINKLAVDIGSRPAGSEEANQATEYITGELKSMGYYPTSMDYKLPDNHTAQTLHAYYPGTTFREIFLVAHIDTVPTSPGANEDASSIALLLELARWIRNYRVPVGVHFLFLGAEEKIPQYDFGQYYSSAQYIEYQKNIGLDFLDGFIRVDKVGAGEHFQVSQIDGTKTLLTDKLVSLAKQLNLPLEQKVVKRWQKSMPFEDAGLPTAWLQWTPDTTTNTSKDTPDKLSKEKIEKTFELLSNYLRGTTNPSLIPPS